MNNWASVWQLAGEICDLLAEDGIQTTARQHERIAAKINDRDGETFLSHSQVWVKKPDAVSDDDDGYDDD